MILYKYLSVDRAFKVLKDKTIAFTTMDSFNDPFEFANLTAFPDKQYNNENILDIFNDYSKKFILNRESSILCLTRQQLNPLMWAHYADNHKGIVIGLNILETNFTSETENIIPAQYGSVIYTVTKPNYRYITPIFKENKIGLDTDYKSKNLELLQRRYLYKSMHWSYEEEVRVVKATSGEDLINTEKKHVNLYKLKEKSIFSIHIGMRCNQDDLARIKPYINKGIEIYKCQIEESTWDMKAKKVEIEHVFKDKNKTKNLKFKPI
ncbi:DUF2971 domain-containing protein [Providencia rettgeri]|uniref:DUF2971 domain-containing protein n=1 Tax=Providencia TaxID=586 RepID=UPI000C7EFDEA|nr:MULTISPECIES: DUF2971 domain-containing protein [Providencia]AXH61458.1 DUF2971 domain-containing protein [Providencia huaxiensis]AXH61469.1 DUF2971 domain-containing protein [Providencia huaxiensis]MBJ9969407.1 DUF2971 domain-containing protein [Providencia rettgeri]MCB6144528.1 DUF2971 domain-containing protein [Providencia rettgeri]MCF8961455.1 hypothetical protein [Providencia rettgeri]